MADQFFEKPILNSPYECPSRHWELDASGQPTQKIIERRPNSRKFTRGILVATPGHLGDDVVRVSRV